ncbi:hypothetical protein MGL_2754 [Malassezia globosa CBS 7966]|uniref:Uncharacterized protein n=1 Tax=Malassezia globosa (strain ATCC MYA-4612 / CBS 7966) TaxID=425265 RepID=A8Q591_MALGO|nr:uncharacterized protein MGL_2754 [Malassezia globosa CBS 7966]EDP43158.1 hypothetical protein MGL_2754 [Malassezia globosa CBS 7966]
MTALTSNDTAHKIQQGISYKQEGNAAFLQRDYVGALRSYHYATLYLAGLDEQVLQQFGGSSRGYDVREDQKQLSQVRSNMAACYLAQERFARAVHACDQALVSDPSNAKAIFRKAQALRRQGAIYQAKDWLESDAVCEYVKGPDFDAEKSRIAVSISERERKSHAKWRGFLS